MSNSIALMLWRAFEIFFICFSQKLADLLSCCRCTSSNNTLPRSLHKKDTFKNFPSEGVFKFLYFHSKIYRCLVDGRQKRKNQRVFYWKYPRMDRILEWNLDGQKTCGVLVMSQACQLTRRGCQIILIWRKDTCIYERSQGSTLFRF